MNRSKEDTPRETESDTDPIYLPSNSTRFVGVTDLGQRLQMQLIIILI